MTKNLEDIRLKDGTLPPAAWPGFYPLFYLGKGNAVLCHQCADENVEDVIDYDTHLEGLPLTCEDCGEPIESAYGPTPYDEVPPGRYD